MKWKQYCRRNRSRSKSKEKVSNNDVGFQIWGRFAFRYDRYDDALISSAKKDPLSYGIGKARDLRSERRVVLAK
jgi:hypothetical protein